MRITERRLRSIIRSVIKESMEDYTSPGDQYRSYDPVNDAIEKVRVEIESCGASFKPRELEHEKEYYADGDGVYRIPCKVDDVNGYVDITSYGEIVDHTFHTNPKLRHLTTKR